MATDMKYRISVPLVPNFISCNGHALPITDFDESAIREIGARMTENMVKKALKRRSKMVKVFTL